MKDEIQARQERALDEQRREREERESAAGRQLAANARENAAVRARYLAGLTAEREAKRRAAEAADEQALVDDGKHRRVRREWLAAHPGSTTADFDGQAWPHLRANILEERRRAAEERSQQALRARRASTF